MDWTGPERRSTPGASALDLALVFDAMVELAVLHEIVVDGDGKAVDYRILDCNRAFTTVTGIARERAVGRLASEVYGTAPPHLEIYAEVAATGTATRFESYFAPMDRHFSISVVCPRPGQFFTVSGDVTEQRRADAALRRYELLSAHQQDAILFVRRTDGRILDANAAATKMYGYARGELLALEVRQLREPATRELALAQMSAADRGGVRFEAAHVRKDGSTFPVEVTSQGATLDGDRVLVSVIRDVSKRRQAELALAQAEEVLRLTVEQAPIGFALTSLEGRFLRVNRALADFLGYEPEELTRMSFAELTHPDDLQANLGLLERLFAGELPRFSMDKRYVHRSGRTVEAAIHVAVVRNESGRPLHQVTLVEDVTARKRLQARLMQTERLAALGTLAGGIAHEVNNPLACIISSMELLAGTLAPSAAPDRGALTVRAVKEIIEDTQAAAERIGRTVRALRVFSHGDQARPVPLDVIEVLETTVALVAGELRNRARLVRQFEQVPKVLADEGRLAQAFLIVLMNACHTIPSGTPDRFEIRLSTRTAEAGGAVIECCDTGPGLATRELDPALGPASGVGSGLATHETDGAGLALSVAREIVTGLSGHMAAALGPGGGTRFTIVLPAATPAALGDPEDDVA